MIRRETTEREMKSRRDKETGNCPTGAMLTNRLVNGSGRSPAHSPGMRRGQQESQRGRTDSADWFYKTSRQP